MKKIILVLFFFIFYSSAEDILFSPHLYFFNPENTDLIEILGNRQLSGNDLSSSLQTMAENNFYSVPFYKGTPSGYQNGFYKIINNSFTGKTEITNPDTGLKIILSFNKNGMLKSKEVFIDDQAVDSVKYFYKDKKLIKVTSKLYGSRFFVEPQNWFDRLLRLFGAG